MTSFMATWMGGEEEEEEAAFARERTQGVGQGSEEKLARERMKEEEEEEEGEEEEKGGRRKMTTTTNERKNRTQRFEIYTGSQVRGGGQGCRQISSQTGRQADRQTGRQEACAKRGGQSRSRPQLSSSVVIGAHRHTHHSVNYPLATQKLLSSVDHRP